jgi:2-oxoglutarate ferredoxin oxidoreductase subunit beta
MPEGTVVFARPEALEATPTHYCPGCTHGIIHRLIAEVIDELGIREKIIGIAPVGCSVLAYHYFNFDTAEAAHGRAPAVATGMKRVRPENVVFTYQGDGDLAAIGTAEIVHAANRGENITVIFVNNAVFGMTGGQMAPTTLPGQVTTSTPTGRNVKLAGYPLKVAELLTEATGAAYVVRRTVTQPKYIRNCKKAIKTAFQTQLAGLGFSLVEVLSTCSTNWGLSPIEAMRWLEDHMIPYYPLGDYKVIDEVKALQ